MASRTRQKEEARARRLAEEQVRAERARQQRRLQMLGGVVILAIVVVIVAVVVSSGGSQSHSPIIPTKANTPAQKRAQQAALRKAIKADAPIFALLKGIPQHGNTLGNPHAKVSIVEYGDLECPICRDFALGSENQIIANDVRSGKARLTYKSLETATGGAPDPKIFGPQQAAAYAAGFQDKAWYYIELFYREQGTEGTGYANQGYFDNLAKQVPGLNMSQWQTDSRRKSLINSVVRENQKAISYLTGLGATSNGQVSTPTIVVSGPKGLATPIIGVPQSYAQVETEINEVQ